MNIHIYVCIYIPDLGWCINTPYVAPTIALCTQCVCVYTTQCVHKHAHAVAQHVDYYLTTHG